MHALYRFYGEDGTLLYVGITNNPPRRFAKHRGENDWWLSVARIDLEQFETRADLAEGERRAIRDEAPRYNIVGNPPPPVQEAATDEADGLVGRWFHSYKPSQPDDDVTGATLDSNGNKRVWQGQVIGREGPMLVLQLYSWWDGFATDQILHSPTDMGAWRFYDSSQAMQTAHGCPEDFGNGRRGSGRQGKCGAPCTHVIRAHAGLGPIYRCEDCIKFYSGTVELL